MPVSHRPHPGLQAFRIQQWPVGGASVSGRCCRGGTRMNAIKLHPLKKLEIILEGAHKEFATDLLDRAGVKGYTIVGNLSGKGRHGMYEGHLMFNEDDALIMII